MTFLSALLFAMPSVSSGSAAAACDSAAPTVTTDKADYGATETALISGSGFACGGVFHVKVTAPDGSFYSGDGTGSPGPDTVTADESGAFSLSYSLAGQTPWSATSPGSGAYSGQSGMYTVEVSSEGGEVIATTTFTDASQLANPVPASVIVTHNGLEWVWASPCAQNGCTAGILVGKDGFRFATAAEWALRPPVSAFFHDKCAAPWFDQSHNHCDWTDPSFNGDGIYFDRGLLGSAPLGGLPAGPDGTYQMDYLGETWLVRGFANMPPAVDAGGPYSGAEGSTIALDGATASDPDGVGSLSYAWTILSSSVGSGSCSLSNASSLTGATLSCTDSGTATVRLTASEPGLGLSGSATASVTIDNSAPSVTLSSGNILTWNESGTAERSFGYSASDPAGANDPLAFTVDCGANGIYVAGSNSFASAAGTGTFRCVFPDGPASSTVTVTANDGDGGSAHGSQTVTVVNVAPTVTVVGPVSANEGETKAYTYTVSDPGNDPSPTVSEDCGANGTHVADAAPGSFKCTFPDGPASSIVRVTANDGDPTRNLGTSSRTVTVANVAPTVTPVEPGRIYWTDHGSDLIQTATIDGANVQTLLDTASVGSTRPGGIAVDPVGAKLYWTDSGDFSGQASTGLYGASLDGASPVAFMTGSGFFAAQGVDVDADRGMLYWGPTHEAFRGDISRIRTSNLDGTNPTPVLDHTVSFLPGGLAVDLVGGKIYWGDTTASRLSRADLDGSDAEIGWIAAGCDVRDLDVDEAAGQVYFTCGLGGTIRRVKTDGTGLTTLVTGQAFPREIELDVAAGKMYWTELNTAGPGRIRRANLNGSNVEDVVVGLVDPHGIALIPSPPGTLSGPRSANEGETKTYTYLVSDPGDDANPLVSEECGPNGTYVADPDPHSFKCTFSDGPASSTVKVTVDDGDGVGLASKGVTIRNVAPAVTLSGPASADEGDTKTYTYTVADPGDDSPTISEDCGANGTYIGDADANSFQCAFPDGPASSTVAVSADDGDPADNIGSDSKAVSVAEVAPSILLSGSESAAEGETKTYTYTVSDPGDDPIPAISEECGASGVYAGDADANSFQCTFPDGPGSSTVTVTGDTVSASKTVTIANVAPTVTLSGAESANEGETKVYTYSVSDPGDDPSPAISEECGADGTYAPDADAGSFTCTFRDGPASSTVKVTADDGDDLGSAAKTVAIANVAPTVTLSGAESADEGETKVYTYSVSDPGDDPSLAISEECGANSTYAADVDAGSFSCSFPDGPAVSVVKVTADDGDPEGNLGSAAKTVSVANVAPTVTLSGPESADEGETKAYTYSVSDPGDDPSPAISEECGANGTYTADADAASFSCSFPDGPASSTVKVTADDGDAANNVGSDAKTVAIANVAPTVTLSGAESANEGETKVYTYSLSDPGDDPSPAISEQCGANGSYVSDADAASFTCTFPDGPASSTVTVTADDGGDTVGSAAKTVTVANVAPTVTLSGAEAANEGETKVYTYAVSDPGDDPSPAISEECGANGSYVADADAASFACRFPDGPGSSTVKVTADDGDAADNIGAAAKTVSIANVAPTVTLTGAGSADEGETKLYTYSVSDPGDDPNPTVREACGDAGNYAADADAGSFTCTFPDGPAISTVKVTVDDGDSIENVGSAAKTVTVSNVAPSVTLSASNELSVLEGGAHTYSFTISDPGQDAVAATTTSCSGTGSKLAGSDSFTNAGGSFKCSFADGPASSTVSAAATDEDGAAGAGATQTVTVENVAPALAAPGDQAASEGTSKAFTLGSFADPAADSPWAVDVDWGDGSPHATFDRTTTGSLGTQSHAFPDNGEYTVTVTVRDADGASDSKNFKVTVANVPPTADGGGPYSGPWGSELTLDGSGTSDPAGANDTLTYCWDFDYSGTFAADACAVDLRKPKHAYAAPGSYVAALRVSDEDGGTSSIDTAAVTITLRATALGNTTTQTAVQYTDSLTVSARLTDADTGPLNAAALPGKTVTFTITFTSPAQPAMSATATTDANGNATAQVQVLKQAGSYAVAASFAGDGRYKNASSAGKTGSVKQEDSRIEYTGDTIAQVGTSLSLRATAWDSAAAGYAGASPESGGGGTMGALTKMWIAFDIYSATSCGSGTPSAIRYAQVQDTGTAGDGIGTAAQTYTSSSESSHCVVARLVDDGNAANGSTNQWYAAENAQAAVITFYSNTGKFVTGGGWINDPSGGKGNFGFNARYAKSGASKGQLVYVYRALYTGPCVINGIARTCTNVPADFRIKSSAITRSAFFGSTYPLRATLEGKSTIQINRASDGYVLYSDGNATFSATVTDTNQNGGAGDDFSLTVYDKNAVRYKTVPTTILQGGNVVIHVQ